MSQLTFADNERSKSTKRGGYVVCACGRLREVGTACGWCGRRAARGEKRDERRREEGDHE